MDNELDFTNASVDDFKLAGEVSTQPVVETPAETTSVESAPAVETPAVETPVDTAPKDVKPTEKSAEYKFKDDFIKNVVDFYEKTGDISPYLQAKLVDFNQMTDQEIMRRNLKEQYPDVSDKAFEKLYQQQIVDKYKLDTDIYDEDDSELGRELLKSEASKLRSQYLDWQKNFTAPVRAEDQTAKEQQQELEDKLRTFEQSVKSNPLTNNILTDKRISLGDFSFEVTDPSSIVDMTLDNEKFFSQFASDDGQVDFNRWYKTAAYSQNQELFEKTLINHGRTLGREEITKEIKNPSIAQPEGVPTEGSSDFMSGLLQAFQSRGVHK